MIKRKLKLLNFIDLSANKYNKIRDYRNQEYIIIRSKNTNLISKQDHSNYLKLLKKQDKYFAYLITNNNEDYGVITFNKIDKNTFLVGDYLVKEEYKYEGGGVANRYCMLYLANKLNIKFIQSEIQTNNTRGHRAGAIAKIKKSFYKDGYLKEFSEFLKFDDPIVVNSKARKLFDKIYSIEEF